MIMLSDYKKVSEIPGELILLDLTQVSLWGFQGAVSKDNFQKILECITNKEILPPVNICRFSASQYFLTNLVDDATMHLDGGHTRSYAHYIAKMPLLCREVDFRHSARGSINIRDIIIQ